MFRCTATSSPFLEILRVAKRCWRDGFYSSRRALTRTGLSDAVGPLARVDRCPAGDPLHVYDAGIFHPGSTPGLGLIQLHDSRQAFEGIALPNVTALLDQAETFEKLLATDPPGLDHQSFECMVRDMSTHALALYAQPSSTPNQMAPCQTIIRTAVHDPARRPHPPYGDESRGAASASQTSRTARSIAARRCSSKASR